MKTTIGLFVFLLLVVMLPGGWAHQPAEDAQAQAENIESARDRTRSANNIFIDFLNEDGTVKVRDQKIWRRYIWYTQIE